MNTYHIAYLHTYDEHKEVDETHGRGLTLYDAIIRMNSFTDFEWHGNGYKIDPTSGTLFCIEDDVYANGGGMVAFQQWAWGKAPPVRIFRMTVYRKGFDPLQWYDSRTSRLVQSFGYDTFLLTAGSSRPVVDALAVTDGLFFNALRPRETLLSWVRNELPTHPPVINSLEAFLIRHHYLWIGVQPE